LRLDSNSKYKLLEKEVQSLREQASSHEGDSDTLSYVAHSAEENPFPRRPKNTGLKPEHYNLYGDQTADLLAAKSHSSLKYEYRTLAPVLSYFFDAKLAYEEEREDEEFEQLSESQRQIFDAILNTLDGCYAMLSMRQAVIKIRARAESETGGLSEENQLLLNYLETKLHGVFPGEALVDSDMESWLKE
jgi:hypothetical protein